MKFDKIRIRAIQDKTKSIESAGRDLQTVKNTFRKRMDTVDLKAANGIRQLIKTIVTCDDIQVVFGLNDDKYKFCKNFLIMTNYYIVSKCPCSTKVFKAIDFENKRVVAIKVI